MFLPPIYRLACAIYEKNAVKLHLGFMFHNILPTYSQQEWILTIFI